MLQISPVFRPAKPLGLWLVMAVFLTTITGLFSSQAVQAADTLPKWTEISLQPIKYSDIYSIDGTRPNSLVSNHLDYGTFRQDWNAGTSKQLQTSLLREFNFKTGIYYSTTRTEPEQVIYFSLNNPQGEVISRLPNLIADNGSLQVYSVDPTFGNVQNLYASSDGGKTWQKRSLPSLGKIASSLNFSLASADPRVIYVLTQEDAGSLIIYRIFVSTDSGVHWERQGDFQTAKPDPSRSFGVYLYNLEGYSVPVDTLIMEVSTQAGAKYPYKKLISTDAGRTFNEVDPDLQYLSYDNNGFVGLKKSGDGYSLNTSGDGGKTWQKRPLPFNIPAEKLNLPDNEVSIRQISGVPGNFVVNLRKGDFVWRTSDSGRTWQKIAPNLDDLQLIITPYSPTSFLGLSGGKFYTLSTSLTEVDKTHTQKAAANKIKDGLYFPSTGHNLSGVFKKYWEEHGGLAQFGYPQTEPFREYNPDDGKVYLVQYFERNRFEYHPELAGTNYEVLLGLLGNQLTAQRRAAGESAFNRFPNLNYPGGQYFPATGHNLRNSFKQYWDANGGLAQFGYPTSEEFYEVNPDNGKTYVVQYFERNRFEYHPENKGTRYEVLLGLLGNTLLKQKGWL